MGHEWYCHVASQYVWESWRLLVEQFFVISYPLIKLPRAIYGFWETSQLDVVQGFAGFWLVYRSKWEYLIGRNQLCQFDPRMHSALGTRTWVEMQAHGWPSPKAEAQTQPHPIMPEELKPNPFLYFIRSLEHVSKLNVTMRSLCPGCRCGLVGCGFGLSLDLMWRPPVKHRRLHGHCN